MSSAMQFKAGDRIVCKSPVRGASWIDVGAEHDVVKVDRRTGVFVIDIAGSTVPCPAYFGLHFQQVPR